MLSKLNLYQTIRQILLAMSTLPNSQSDLISGSTVQNAELTEHKQPATTDKTEKEITRISKFMSYVLRHGTNERSIKIDSEGYVLLDDLMKQPEMKPVSVSDVMYVVENNDKKRYAVLEKTTNHGTKLYIRANQGHCKEVGAKIDDLSLLKKMDKPISVCVHGTDKKSWHIIKTAGLSPMKRKHVHLASGLASDDSVISGMRGSSKVIIYIDMQKAMDRGKVFYLSTNGVILTPDNLEPDLFDHVDFK